MVGKKEAGAIVNGVLSDQTSVSNGIHQGLFCGPYFS